MNYRRKWGTPLWHASPGCSNWPESALEAEERANMPTQGVFCRECQMLALGLEADDAQINLSR